MDDLQKSIQIADDLDEQATRLNVFISNPSVKKKDRLAAVDQQLALRQHAAALRVDAIQEIIGDAAPSIDQIVSAADAAKSAANKINTIKKSLDLAAATIALLAAVAAQDVTATTAALAALNALSG